jgi:hypothetical protein
MKQPGKFKFGTVVKAAIFCSIAVTVIESLIFDGWIFSAFRTEDIQPFIQAMIQGQFTRVVYTVGFVIQSVIVMTFLKMFLHTGARGAVFGTLNSIYLMLRTKRIGVGHRMFVETGVLGAVLGLFLPVPLEALLGRQPIPFRMLVVMALGFLVSILYAAWLRRSMLSSASPSPTTPLDTKEANTTQS